jgi:hypothetical protein
MVGSTLLEICTPLAPHMFLLLASVANVGRPHCLPCCIAHTGTRAGKNVSWLAASATKAGIHKSFLRHENLSDVTAKSGSQTIAASVAGDESRCARAPRPILPRAQAPRWASACRRWWAAPQGPC